MKFAHLIVGAALFLPTLAPAQIDLGTPNRVSAAKKQHVLLLTDSLQLKANHPQDVELRFRVEPGYHINSHTPHDELLLPTELKLDGGALQIGHAQYPSGSRFHLAVGSGEDLDVYQDEFRVMLRVEAPKGESTLTGALRYQACDTAACFPPRTLPIQIAVTAD